MHEDFKQPDDAIVFKVYTGHALTLESAGLGQFF